MASISSIYNGFRKETHDEMKKRINNYIPLTRQGNDGDRFIVGQSLIIPPAPQIIYTVGARDSLWTISLKFNVPINLCL